MRGPTESADAILLRSVDYGDADRIVTLLTDRLGKVAVVARGARRSRRRFAGALEPFCVLNAEMVPGREELGWLKQARVTRAFPRILKDLDAMAVGGAALELVRMGTPARQPDPRVFTVTQEMFELLEGSDEGLEEAFTCFGARLMTLLGFEPSFDTCGRCGRGAAERNAAEFDPQEGHLVCRACGGAPLPLCAAARRLLASATGPGWRAAVGRWPDRHLREARRAVISFIECRLERPVSAPRLTR